MQKTALCLWFDTEAREAADFYSSVFPECKIENITRYLEGDRKPKGTPLIVRLSLYGLELDLLNGGPEFQLNPSISLYINCKTDEEVNNLWGKLSEDGNVLMELAEYPFSKRFGWLNDKYGVSWQISLDSKRQKVTPFLMFTRENHGKAEQAAKYYCNMFNHSVIGSVSYFAENEGEPAGTVKSLEFTIEGQQFMAMGSAASHKFTFNEAASLMLYCETQEEIDYAWDSLTSNGGEESVCGWLKDPFGISWQIVNDDFEMMIDDSNPERAKRVTEAVYNMKKIDIQKLREVYNAD